MGIRVAPSSPMVSHLLFVNGSLLLFRVNRENSKEARNVLNLYCSASGQQINFDKSSIHFAKGCSVGVRSEIKEILNVQNEALSEKYLDMPTDMDSSLSGAFTYVSDRV
jgi:hypothetical protein